MQQTVYARIANERLIRKRGVVAARRSKTLIDILKDSIRSLIVFLFNQVGVCVLLISYNVIGAFSFRAIEGINGDASVEDQAESALNLSISLLWNSTLHLNILEEKLWRKDANETVLAFQRTLVPLIRYRNYRGVRPINAWTIPGSLMYCLSVYTTIGYGNLTPRTEAGKVATIFYALLGMPLMLLYMSNLGEILARIFKFIYFGICSCGMSTLPSQKAFELTGTTTSRSKDSSENPTPSSPSSKKYPRKSNRPRERPKPVRDWSKESIPILWCLIVMSAFVFFGGMLFAHWEGWTTLDGCYFCYISLSTVGFGDLVPGKVLTDDDGDDTDVETIQVLVTIYLLVGMALVAMCFNLMQEEALQNVKTFWRSLGCLRRKKKVLTSQNQKSKEQTKQLPQGNGEVSAEGATSTDLKKDSVEMNEHQSFTMAKFNPYKRYLKVKTSLESSYL